MINSKLYEDSPNGENGEATPNHVSSNNTNGDSTPNNNNSNSDNNGHGGSNGNLMPASAPLGSPLSHLSYPTSSAMASLTASSSTATMAGYGSAAPFSTAEHMMTSAASMAAAAAAAALGHCSSQRSSLPHTGPRWHPSVRPPYPSTPSGGTFVPIRERLHFPLSPHGKF